RDRAQCHHMIVGAAISHHPDGFNRQQDRERLPDLVVQPRFTDLFDIDRVDLAEQIEPFFGDWAEYADCEPRAREWVASDDLLGQPQFASHQADLVLEQLPERLAEL